MSKLRSTFNKLGILHSDKGNHEKPTVNIIVNGKRPEALLRAGTRQGRLLCHFHSTHIVPPGESGKTE